MRAFLLFMVALALAAPAWAFDGETVASGGTTGATWKIVKLCDEATGGATKTCAEVDIGQPTFLRASIESVAGCAGATAVALEGLSTTGSSTTHTMTTTALTVAGTSAEVITYPAFNFVEGDVTVGTGCTDFEVHLLLFYTK